MNRTADHPTSGPALDAAGALADVLQSLGLQAEPAQRAQLLAYLDLLRHWNRVYNLTAVRDPDAMFSLHLADCLALLPALDARAPRRVLDVGSGGGLPGLVLAIMRPQWQIVLNDAVQKKCAFLQHVAATLGLRNVTVVHGRVEDQRLDSFDCITSRAFAELALLVRLTRHLLAPTGCWAAMKGAAPDAELAALPPDVTHQVQALHVPGLQAQRCVVWLHPVQASAGQP